MIHYDPHRWLDHFFDIRGTLLKEVGPRVGTCVLWASGVVVFHKYVWHVSIPLTLHSLVGVALGLLLVFRTNASYDRYWEGRKLWGGIVNASRNLVRAASVHLRDQPDYLVRLTRWTAVFPWTALSTLRGEFTLGPLAGELTADELFSARNAQHPALFVAQEITACLLEAKSHGLLTDIQFLMLDQNIQLLVDHLGGCERIRKTPLPFAYVVHLRRALVIYCFTLPFALVGDFGWFTLVAVLLVAYTFFGIEEIGVEIEGPFGNDENDLPMEDICATIHRNLYALAGLAYSKRDKLPEGL